MRPSVLRRITTTALLAAMGAATASGCEVTVDNEACDRLRSLSCGCFPDCQTADIAVIDARESAECDARVREVFAYWSTCRPESLGGNSCGPNCEYGWGACAFDVYRELGLEPLGACGAHDAGDEAG
jgi:hypothetical protein